MGDRGTNMNISGMVRGIMGDAKPGEARVLELKTGQQVRGVVQSVAADGKEAVVQINGVAVKAVLESPMQPGQATWLQVSGQLEDGSIVLKPSDGPNAQPMTSVADALKQAGLPDEPWARQLVQEMQKNGVPLTREMMEQLGNAMKMKPAAVSVEQWAQTVAVAMKRQLPLTAAGLTGLQQAMFGKPLNELLTNFLNQAQLMQGSMANGSNGGAAAVMKEAQALVRTLLAMMPSVNASAETQAAPLAGSSANSANGGGASAQAGTGSQASAQAQPQLQPGQGAPAAGASQAAAGQAALTQTTADAGLGKGTAVPQAPMGAEAGRVAAQVQPGSGNGAGAGQAPTGAAAGSAAGAGAAAGGSASAAQQSAQAAQGGSTQAQAAHAGGMIGRMLTLLGVSHEHVMQRVLLAPGGTAAAHPAPAADAAPQQAAPQAASTAAAAARTAAEGAPLVPAGAQAAAQAMPQAAAQQAALGQQATAQQQAAQPAAQALQAGAADAHESLKSTLLQLLKSDSLPPAIRESAQQIVQQITGQQLLLSGDRSQPFAHVTMFVPFVTEDGEQTAAVHIQSRQGRKGELDAENCRLWFDLDLKALGHTMVDVNVVEKLVALNIHHADEQVHEQLLPFRTEIETALESIGYQMSAYRVMPFPEKEETAPAAERLMKDYTVESYKGVDLRI